MSSWTKERASVAAHVRNGNDEAADAARQRLRAIRAEDYIKRLVESAPPLSDETRTRLALLLKPGAAA